MNQLTEKDLKRRYENLLQQYGALLIRADLIRAVGSYWWPLLIAVLVLTFLLGRWTA